MKPTFKDILSKTRRLLPMLAAVASLGAAAHAAVPGIQGPNFNLTANWAYLTQPDGQSLYSWGYGCTTGSVPTFNPVMPGNFCSAMQVPGPTLIVTEGTDFKVTLTNNLPTAAGNTSILFPGLSVSADPATGTPGLLTQEAAPGGSVTYTIHAPTAGTHSYYSGTDSDLQIEMGLFGAIVVLPGTPQSVCDAGLHLKNVQAETANNETDFRLAHSAYSDPNTCYDREYLFQFSEMDPAIHWQAQTQVERCGSTVGCLHVSTEPYHPAYFMINGRSMPDDMDSNYAPEYPHQPYNGNPHMHPGEQVLLRIIGQGRWQHPFHEHANHVRVLARDGNLLLSPKGMLAGPALFTTTTTPGQTIDGIFYYTGRGLNWDMYGHNPASQSGDANATLPCIPDANGYYTADPTKINYFEWCQDHNKPLQTAPTGDVAGYGPVTLPDPNILFNGAWFGGSPYLGPDATVRAVGATGTTPPSGTVANPPSSEAGFAFMWHSHNEREITTNNAFPGGMMMMMLVDSREYVIDESK
jgi:FtsP/CotA-like multicopper oxidase with cupredoxin domain